MPPMNSRSPVRSSLLVLLLFPLGTAACGVKFNEQHIFAQSQQATTAANYLRIDVEGRSRNGNARYIAGFYDERAVDLFFNEIKPGQSTCGTLGCGADALAVRPICGVSPDGSPNCQRQLAVGDPSTGAFLMLFSTNAAVVADAIGQFAENQSVADALTSLASRDRVREIRQRTAASEAFLRSQTAVVSEVSSILDHAATNNASAQQQDLLRVIRVLARASGYRGVIETITDAERWLESQR